MKSLTQVRKPSSEANKNKIKNKNNHNNHILFREYEPLPAKRRVLDQGSASSESGTSKETEEDPLLRSRPYTTLVPRNRGCTFLKDRKITHYFQSLSFRISPLQNHRPNPQFPVEADRRAELLFKELEKLQRESTAKTRKYELQIAEYEQSKSRDRLYINQLQKMVCTLSLEKQQIERTDLQRDLLFDKARLGESVEKRVGCRFEEMWVDGKELATVKTKLEAVFGEIQEVEKVLQDLETRKKNSKQSRNNSQTSNSSSFVIDMERQASKLEILQREEAELHQSLQRLEREKALYQLKSNLNELEGECQFGRSNSNLPAWPLIAGRYQLLSLLGKGGFSEVYKALDLETLTFVAFKVHQVKSTSSKANKQNFLKYALREASVQKQLHHPNIVHMMDQVTIDANSFATITEYCDGMSLSTYLKKYGKIPENEALGITRQIISGLYYLQGQEKPVIHYDLKPDNILFHQGVTKITDFGICKVMHGDSDRIELTSQGLGTYWYLPPECFLEGGGTPTISSKVDIWSVGVLLFQMLYGIRPFGHELSQPRIYKDQVILKAFSVKFPSEPDISPETKDFIEKCLAYDERYRVDVKTAHWLQCEDLEDSFCEQDDCPSHCDGDGDGTWQANILL